MSFSTLVPTVTSKFFYTKYLLSCKNNVVIYTVRIYSIKFNKFRLELQSFIDHCSAFTFWSTPPWWIIHQHSGLFCPTHKGNKKIAVDPIGPPLMPRSPFRLSREGLVRPQCWRCQNGWIHTRLIHLYRSHDNKVQRSWGEHWEWVYWPLWPSSSRSWCEGNGMSFKIRRNPYFWRHITSHILTDYIFVDVCHTVDWFLFL